MKKFGFLIFIQALIISLLFASSCNYKSYSSVNGSGAAKSETRNVTNFTKIKVEGAVEIEITAQKSFAVEITADDNLLPLIKTETDGDTLKISGAENSSAKSKTFVKISMPELEKLDVSGASSGNISNVKTDSLELTLNGASKIKIDGSAHKLKAQANGASAIDAENLKTENADVEANGVSSAMVSATEELKAEANGASTIVYTGDPKDLKQNTAGASSIKKK